MDYLLAEYREARAEMFEAHLAFMNTPSASNYLGLTQAAERVQQWWQAIQDEEGKQRFLFHKQSK